MYKAISYNAKDETFTEVNIDNYTEIYNYLECHTFGVVSLQTDIKGGIDVYIDDEGLFVENPIYSLVQGYPNQPLAGNLLFTGGADRQGNTKSIKATVEQIKAIVRKLSADDLQKLIHSGRKLK